MAYRGDVASSQSTPARVRTVAIVAAAVVMAACGSTARQEAVDEVGPRRGSSDAELGPESASASPGGSAASPTRDGGSSRSGSQGSATGRAAPTGQPTSRGPEAGSPPRASAGSVAMGKGVTDTTIRLGFTYIDNAGFEGTESAFGLQNVIVTADEPQGPAKAAIDYVNAHGGIAGRRVVPIWFRASFVESLNKERRQRQAQRACATFTEDNKVFAFPASTMYMESNILECAVRTKTPFIDSNDTQAHFVVSERQFLDISTYYYHLTGMLGERREGALFTSLRRQGFFTRGAKVGLMVYDTPAVRQGVDRALKPALKDLGLEFTEVIYPDTIESPWDTYVLNFRTAGVTHVIFSAAHGEGAAVLLFMRAAENQQFRPRYGIGGGPILTIQSGAPKEQLRKTMGTNWVPWMLEGGTDSSPPVSANDAACRQAMKEHGQPSTPSNLFHYCNYLFFLKHALERASALTPEGLAASVATLGTSWQTAGLTYNGAARFSARQHDAVELVRDFAWDKARDDRFVYTSKPYAAPRW